MVYLFIILILIILSFYMINSNLKSMMIPYTHYNDNQPHNIYKNNSIKNELNEVNTMINNKNENKIIKMDNFLQKLSCHYLFLF